MARYVLITVATLLLAGCGFAESHIRLAYGNFEFSQGRYERARELFLGIPVAESVENGELETLRDYNVGAVEYAVGNFSAALERWQDADTGAAEEEVLYRARFNSGVIHFEQGRYERAYRAFRDALKTRPGREGAQRNLELAFQRWHRAGGAEAAGSVTESGDVELEEEAEQLLQQLQEREQERRQLREEFEPREDVDDW